MVNFGHTPRSSSEDKGLLYTGVYLRPSVASSLQRIVRNRIIQERAQFTVVKSQVHPNGLCEIVAKKFSPEVSNVSIMEILRQCRECVQDSSPSPSCNGVVDTNKTIDISDGDDSVCVLSPAHSASSFRRRFSTPKQPSISSISSNSTLKLEGNESVHGITTLTSPGLPPALTTLGESDKVPGTPSIHEMPTFIREFVSLDSENAAQALDSSLNMQSTSVANDQACTSESVNQKTCHLKRASSDILQSTSSAKRPNLTICGESMPEDADSSVLILDISLDSLPSAPTLANDKFSSLSKVHVSRNVIECSQFPLLKSTGVQLGTSTRGKPDSNPLYSQVLKADQNSSLKPSTSNMSVEILDLCEDTLPIKPNHVDTKKSVECETSARSESIDEASTMSEGKKKGETQKTKDLVTLSVASHEPVGVGSAVQCTTPTSDKSLNSSGSSSTSSSSVESLDDIIIEKEVKNTTVVIEDSEDDDILVCQVLPTSSTQKQPKSKKRKMRQNSSIGNKIPAGSVFVASTSQESANDFIPLKQSWRRLDPRPNYIENKQAKLKKIQERKQKKSEVMKKRHTKENDAASRKRESPRKSAKKHEFDGNIMNPNPSEPKAGLRPIIIDASNVAIGHGRGKFSVRGLEICIKYFTDRGHKVFAFAPKYRRFHVSPDERQILDNLETVGILSFTPSRTLQSGKKLASYDDRFIVQTAAELGGIVVSTDNFRDLLEENEAWRETIEKRLLMFTWVQDMLLFPNDPLGRHGPHLTEFLQFPNSTSKTQTGGQPSTSSSV